MQSQSSEITSLIPIPGHSPTVVADALDFLSFCVEQDDSDPRQLWAEGPRENLRIAHSAGWEPRGDWSTVWADVGRKLGIESAK